MQCVTYRIEIECPNENIKNKIMDNWLYELLELPEECQLGENLSKHFFSSNFDLTSGEKNLLTYSIERVSIVGAIGPEYGGVPSNEELGMESIAILLVELKGGKFEKNARKVSDMIQKHLPQFLFIGLTDSENACVNIASKVKSADDALAVEESYLSTPFLPDALEEMSQKFSFQSIDKSDLNSLWNSYIELVSVAK